MRGTRGSSRTGEAFVGMVLVARRTGRRLAELDARCKGGGAVVPPLEMSDCVICVQTKVNTAMVTADRAATANRRDAVGPAQRLHAPVSADTRLAARPQPIPMGALAPARQNHLSLVLYFVNPNNAPFPLQGNASYKFGTQPFSERGTITRLSCLDFLTARF
jgi:hypothetical protein